MDLSKVFATVDAKDTNTYMTYFAEDAAFTFANAAPAVGQPAIRTLVEGVFASVKALRHRLLDIWERPDAVACRGEVTYTRLDDSEITLPFAGFYRLEHGLIKEYQVFIDAAPLHAPSDPTVRMLSWQLLYGRSRPLLGADGWSPSLVFER